MQRKIGDFHLFYDVYWLPCVQCHMEPVYYGWGMKGYGDGDEGGI